MRKYKQSDTTKVIYFYMVDSTDHVTEETGLTVAVTISKNGAAFGAATGAVAEIGNGTYKLTPSAADVGTQGPIIFRGTATGADSSVIEGIVVAYDPYSSTNLGLTDISAILVDTNSLNDTKIPNTLNTTASGNIGIDWANVENPTTTLDLSSTDIRLVDTATALTTNNDKTSYSISGAKQTLDALNDIADTDIVSGGAINTTTGSVDTVTDITNAVTTDSTSRTASQADVSDLPTNAEFNARTIPSADYVVVTDTIAGVTNAGTVTGNVDGTVSSVVGDVGGDILGDVTSLTASAIDSILDEEVDNDGTSISLRGAQKLALSVLTGETSGGGTGTLAFRDIADTKERVNVTADVNGNRTAINTRDAS